MRILKLLEQIRDFIGRLIIGKEHAVELLKLDDSKLQIAAADQIVAKGLSWRATRVLVNKMLKVKKVPAAKGGKPSLDPFATLWPELYPSRIQPCRIVLTCTRHLSSFGRKSPRNYIGSLDDHF